MVEGAALEKRCAGQLVPWVQIPPSPPKRYTNNMHKTVGTVCFIVDNGKVLLAEIEYPDGKRLWNGIGGVVDAGETPKQAVVREISEETELAVAETEVVEVFILQIEDLDLHVFTAAKWAGTLTITDPTLKQLRWFEFDEVPYQKMHLGNDKWLPEILHNTLAV